MYPLFIRVRWCDDTGSPLEASQDFTLSQKDSLRSLIQRLAAQSQAKLEGGDAAADMGDDFDDDDDDKPLSVRLWCVRWFV